MIFNAQERLSDQQAITATAASTNAIDLQATGTVYGAAAAISRDIGPGEPIPLLIQVTEDFATLTSLDIQLELDSTESFTPDAVVDIAMAVPVAQLVAGYKLPYTIVPNDVNLRYARLKYTVNGSNATAGKITAGIVAGVQTNG
ncbi:MAG: hypothetical protein VX529_08095 [Pseudomonadota bacterium]|nr:hypothetical protein [Pseudomonadota bacterium]